MNSFSFYDETDNICSCIEDYMEIDGICLKAELDKSDGNDIWVYILIAGIVLIFMILGFILYKKYAARRSPRLTGLHPFENAINNYSVSSSILPYASSPVKEFTKLQLQY